MDATPALPPPGRMIDVGTHRMHLYSLGEGTPVVVLDAGSGDNILTWYGIQSEIAKFTQVVSYDRSGLGWSERGSAPRSGAAVVREMYGLLTAANVPAPYVLVGHSMGGVHVRMFTQAYPDLVAGMVLVDSSHEGQRSVFEQAIPKYAAITAGYLESFGALRQQSHAEIIAAMEAFDPPSATMSPELLAMLRDRLRPENMAVILEEMELAGVILNQQGDYERDLGDLPLRVLTASRAFSGGDLTPEEGVQMLEIFQGLQREISARSSRGTQTIVADAGHYIQHDQPQAVIDAIREVVEAVRQSNSA